jgi:hypothetical protein
MQMGSKYWRKCNYTCNEKRGEELRRIIARQPRIAFLREARLVAGG